MLGEKFNDLKKRTCSSEFRLNFKWITDRSQIDSDWLRSQLFNESLVYRIKNNYLVVTLDLEKVLSGCYNFPERQFPINKLWIERREFHKLHRLIEFIEDGNTLFPPILYLTDEGKWKIEDGFHRISLCRFLKMPAIPFLVDEEIVERVKAFLPSL